MRILLCLLFLVSCQVKEKSKRSLKATPSSVINGVTVKETDNSDLSLAAAALVSDEGLCSGILISENVVLTAAHCVDLAKNTPSSVFLGVKGFYLKEDKKDNLYNVKKIIPHPEYNEESDTGDNDIAILILEENARSPLRPMKMFDGLNFVKTGMSLNVAGFSLYSKPLKSDIYNLFSEKISRKYAITNYERLGLSTKDISISLLTRNTIVAQNEIEKGKDSFSFIQIAGGVCSGDSGGPTMVKVKNTLYLTGINRAVFSNKRDLEDEKIDCEFGAVSTSVFIHKDWIINTISDEVANLPVFESAKLIANSKENLCAKAISNTFMIHQFLYESKPAACKETSSMNLSKELSKFSKICQTVCKGLDVFKDQCAFIDRGTVKTIAHHKKACLK